MSTSIDSSILFRPICLVRKKYQLDLIKLCGERDMRGQVGDCCSVYTGLSAAAIRLAESIVDGSSILRLATPWYLQVSICVLRRRRELSFCRVHCALLAISLTVSVWKTTGMSLVASSFRGECRTSAWQASKHDLKTRAESSVSHGPFLAAEREVARLLYRTIMCMQPN